LAFWLISDVDVDAESGLGGRLLTLETFGGAGKAPILVVFRRVLPGVGNAEVGVDVPEVAVGSPVVFKVGTAGVECTFVGRGVGRPEVVTDLVGSLLTDDMDDAEDAGRESASGSSGISGSGFLVFAIGRAGNGPEGGAEGGGFRDIPR
jgi:hypothetical protein